LIPENTLKILAKNINSLWRCSRRFAPGGKDSIRAFPEERKSLHLSRTRAPRIGAFVANPTILERMQFAIGTDTGGDVLHTQHSPFIRVSFFLTSAYSFLKDCNTPLIKGENTCLH
jgi:hypothetical protein